MISPADREEARLELAAYADGQLSAERAAQIRRALERDPELRADLACVEAMAQRLHEAASVADPIDESLPEIDFDVLPDRDIPRATAHRPWAAIVATAGSAALVIALVAAVVLSGTRSTPAPVETATAPSVQLAVVDAKAEGASAVATMEDDNGRHMMRIAATGLPAAPPQHHYEVWLMHDGTPTAVGRLDGGSAMLELPTDATNVDWDAVDVSVEADGGDPAHSGDSILRGPIA